MFGVDGDMDLCGHFNPDTVNSRLNTVPKHCRGLKMNKKIEQLGKKLTSWSKIHPATLDLFVEYRTDENICKRVIAGGPDLHGTCFPNLGLEPLEIQPADRFATIVVLAFACMVDQSWSW